MWNELMHFGVSPLSLVIRASVIYFAVLLLLRIGGKRQIGQMGATEFVSILLISNAVQNSMNGGDNSMVGGVLLAIVLVAFTYLISYLTYRSELFQRLFEGTPRLLIHDGKLITKNLRKEFLSESELTVLIRKQGLRHVGEVKTGILEADGTLSLIRFSELKDER